MMLSEAFPDRYAGGPRAVRSTLRVALVAGVAFNPYAEGVRADEQVNSYQPRHRGLSEPLRRPHRGVDHEMEEMTGRPFYAEVLLDEGRAVAVHSLSELDRFLLAKS